MDRESVTSSNIKSIGHCGTSETLEIEFLNGSVYQYHGVPANTFLELMKAASKGSYMHSHVKAQFTYEKVREASR